MKQSIYSSKRQHRPMYPLSLAYTPLDWVSFCRLMRGRLLLALRRRQKYFGRCRNGYGGDKSILIDAVTVTELTKVF